jgi:hypothetical protein
VVWRKLQSLRSMPTHILQLRQATNRYQLF